MISKILVVLIWIGAAVLWPLKGIWLPLLILVLLHGAEVFLIGLKTGKEQSIPPLNAAALTFCFGIAWWWPLRGKSE